MPTHHTAAKRTVVELNIPPEMPRQEQAVKSTPRCSCIRN
ncbi:hypothetical protein MC7420_4087 [Coleofasciculus chthonoplastes PCC 7420]|uniref:Uncharacterized protein n=1 Tax=Coleofasciculus chthonoplastes PCC 7420 TaxID=118168 RepID=B4VV87_9CYAN|nr:hypothetical protein MC7420_4087 [Coleofasciculus chthonoplastes PCC 7420]